MPSSLRRLATATLVALAAAGGPACSGLSTSDPTASPTPALTNDFEINWSATEPTHLPSGWRVGHCGRITRSICGQSDDNPIPISLFIGTYNFSPRFAELAETEGEAAALEDHARLFLRDFTADRLADCGGDYHVTPDGPTHLVAHDGLIMRYGYTGTLADGRPSEMVTHYAAVRDDILIVVTANAADPGGCTPNTSITTSAHLASFVPILDQIFFAGGLPPLDPPAAT